MPEKRVTSTYVLQAPRMIDDVTAWVDVATVEVKASTRRMTAVRRAVEEWGATIPEGGVDPGVRLIAAEDAEPIPVKPKPPEAPQLEIG